MSKTFDAEALEYHSTGRKGKLEVVPSKPTATQRDLSLAYSPGVAVPRKEIEKDPLLAFEYTARGNLVAVISNGTAVLGLGNIGAIVADRARGLRMRVIAADPLVSPERAARPSACSMVSPVRSKAA